MRSPAALLDQNRVNGFAWSLPATAFSTSPCFFATASIRSVPLHEPASSATTFLVRRLHRSRRLARSTLAWSATTIATLAALACSDRQTAEAQSSSFADSGPPTNTQAGTMRHEVPCLDWLLVEEGFNCLGLVPECWTRLRADLDGRVRVEQPPTDYAPSGVDSTSQLGNLHLDQLAAFACEAGLVESLRDPNSCTEPCSDVFVEVQGGTVDGEVYRNQFAGPCVCTIPEHPLSRAHEFMFSVILPAYFPSVKHPPHF